VTTFEVEGLEVSGAKWGIATGDARVLYILDVF
jgi:hypothetical protein